MVSSSGISYRNYGWSFVTLSSAKEAQYLVSISPLVIAGRNIDVRPFINRQRVKNHISNKPSVEAMLNAMVDLFNTHKISSYGLTVADIQSKLFRTFSYRIDGPEITKIVGDNPKFLYAKRQGTERIFATPKMGANVPLDELALKINNLWQHIQCNYRGNVYEQNNNPTDDDYKNTKQQQQQSEEDESVKSSNSGKSKSPRTKRRSKRNQIKPKEEEYTISVRDFENEFARRYRCAIVANNFGFGSVKELMHSLKTQQKIAFNVVENKIAFNAAKKEINLKQIN